MNKNETVPDKESTKNNGSKGVSKSCKRFLQRYLTGFPEMKYKLSDETIEFLQEKNEGIHVFNHCLKTYPENFLIFYIKMRIYLQQM